jgi:hypothetical protein
MRGQLCKRSDRKDKRSDQRKWTQGRFVTFCSRERSKIQQGVTRMAAESVMSAMVYDYASDFLLRRQSVCCPFSDCS